MAAPHGLPHLKQSCQDSPTCLHLIGVQKQPKLHKWISYVPKLTNNETLELMKKSHIGLLPTYADTYGYSVLEFQAAGCPVITTNVRALPEINNNNLG